MTAISQVYETVLYATDLAAATTFYSSVLELTPLPSLGNRGVVFRVTDHAVLLVFDPAHTTPLDQGVPSHGATGAGHLAFSVPNLEPWRTRFAQHGIPIEREIDWPLGGRSLYVRDPAHNSVELVVGRVWNLPQPGVAPTAASSTGPAGASTAVPTTASTTGFGSQCTSADPLDLLLGHNAWATSVLLQICRGLTSEQWHQPFAMGPGSLHNTFTHMVGAMRYWSDRLLGPPHPVRPFLDHTTERSVDEVTRLHDEAVAELAAAATVARTRGLDAEVPLTLGGVDYRFTYGAMLVHVTTHGMHHRAQCLNMLRHLNLPNLSDRLPEMDVLEWQHISRQSPPAAGLTS
jgi:uncharacterized damage-inducible protein DinB/catechol 2,3-dioxygenase-like lactoylglutathione lyase family enzyme